MGKRFIETELWQEDWFGELDADQKLFWFFILSDCDFCGVWRPNTRKIKFLAGLDIKLDTILDLINVDKERIVVLQNGRWYIKQFIQFQYGPKLNENNRVHASIIKKLLENDLKINPENVNEFEVIKRSIRPLREVNPSAKDKDKDKEKEIVFNKEKFIKNVREHQNGHDEELVLLFINYWTELDKSNKKMRFESEKFFEIPKRLATFEKNEEKWSKSNGESRKQSAIDFNRFAKGGTSAEEITNGLSKAFPEN